MSKPDITLWGDWPQLSKVFEDWLDTPVADRAAWLARQPLSARLQKALAGLIAQHQRMQCSPEFLAELPALAPLSQPPANLVGGMQPGQCLGPWRLVRPLGRGGMSVVWLADRADGELARQVALKLPHAGPQQDRLAHRLLRERRILSTLAHPHIARLYDVGCTDSGAPYLVMEHVQGDSLLAYADRHRLGLRPRVALFRQVVAAVQHAHGRLVLHRDLKPDNILVDADGAAKLLDFGIAKAMADIDEEAVHLALTHQDERLLTPAYASPEQLRGEPLGPGSDIYSLGVLLCELVCGQRPHTAPHGSAAALEQAVLSQPPRPPSSSPASAAQLAARGTQAKALAKALRGDLDAVVLKALAALPADRYSSANELDADLARWLSGHPVQARTPGAWRHVRRFVGRHRLACGVAASLGLALTVASSAALMQGRLAQQEALRATAARDFLLKMFEQADPDLHSGTQLSALDLLAAGPAQANQHLQAQPALRAELLAGMGTTLYRVRDYKGADAALAQAADLFARVGQRSQEAAARLQRLEVANADRRFEAQAELVQALQPLAEQLTADSLLHLRWLRIHGEYLGLQKRSAEAIPWLERCIATARPGFTDELVVAFDARLALSGLHAYQAEPAKADVQLEQAGRMLQVGNLTDPHARAVALAQSRSSIDLYLDRYATLLRWLPDATRDCAAHFGGSSPRCLELTQRQLWARLRTGHRAEALALVPQLLPRLQQRSDRGNQFIVAFLVVRVLAMAHAQDQQPEALAVLKRLVDPANTDPLAQSYQLPTLTTLVDVSLRAGDLAQAEAWLARAEALPVPAPDTPLSPERQRLGLSRGLVLQARGEPTLALTAMAHFCARSKANVIYNLLSLNCVPSLLATGQADAAKAVLTHALGELEGRLGPDAPHVQLARRWLAAVQAMPNAKLLRPANDWPVVI